MFKKIAVQANRYVDSVTLMQIRDKAMTADGAINVEVQMATPPNIETSCRTRFRRTGKRGVRTISYAVSRQRMRPPRKRS